MNIRKHILIIIMIISVNLQNKTYASSSSYSRTTIRENTVLSSQQESINYIDKCYNAFIKRADSQSGFMYWKDIRDYLNLGQESLDARTKRIWYSIYKKEELNKIIHNNIKDAYILLGLNTSSIKIDIGKCDKEINIYSHRVVLGLSVMLCEELLELALSTITAYILISIIVLLFTKYMFITRKWKRWSKKRKEKVDRIVKKIKSLSAFLSFVTFIVLSFYFTNVSDMAIKKKVEDNFKKTIRIEVESNFNKQ